VITVTLGTASLWDLHLWLLAVSKISSGEILRLDLIFGSTKTENLEGINVMVVSNVELCYLYIVRCGKLTFSKKQRGYF